MLSDLADSIEHERLDARAESASHPKTTVDAGGGTLHNADG